MKIAIAGNKGGVGKTLVALNFFYAIKDFVDQSCTLVDAHIQAPNIKHYLPELSETAEETVSVRIPEIDISACTFCGRCLQYCAYDSILMQKEAGHIKVLDDYCTSCGACVYACNDGAISERTEDLGKVTTYTLDSHSFVEGRMFAVRPLASPIISKLNEQIKDESIKIIDTPPGQSYPFAESIRDADFTLLVTEPTQSGLVSLKANINLLKDMRLRFGVLLNKTDGDYPEISAYLKEEEVNVFMEIPFQRTYGEMHCAGQVIVEHDVDLKQAFQQLYQSIEVALKGGVE